MSDCLSKVFEFQSLKIAVMDITFLSVPTLLLSN